MKSPTQFHAKPIKPTVYRRKRGAADIAQAAVVLISILGIFAVFFTLWSE